MPAQKYEQETKYLLRAEETDMEAYKDAARAERLSLADWINRQLRAAAKRQAKKLAAS